MGGETLERQEKNGKGLRRKGNDDDEEEEEEEDNNDVDEDG